VQSAIDWLEKNQDKSLDDINAEDQAKELAASQTNTTSLEGEQEARSLICNECGKKFRNHVQAEFHASKTYVSSTIPSS
jgi:UBX domain-containing protein 1/4